MPAKKTVTREKILNAAFKIVKDSGIEALNMRLLAKECNCSTQPLYLSFRNAEEIKSGIYLKTVKLFEDYLKNEAKSGNFSGYKAYGMGYVRFAAEQPNLYKLLFMSGVAGGGNTNSFDMSVNLIVENYNISREKAVYLHTQLWIFVHGIATMIVTGYLKWDMPAVDKMLSDVFYSIMNYQGEI